MRRVRYCVAVSLDGFIAGPGGEHDWIVMDPTIDFAKFFQDFDTVLMGRRTFETTLERAGPGGMPGMCNFVFSRKLSGAEHPKVNVSRDAVSTVTALRAKSGKDIWLMGGGLLFGSLVARGLVDSVEVGIVPILLGGGVPLFPLSSQRIPLHLTQSKAHPSGVVSLSYSVQPQPSRCGGLFSVALF